MRVSIDGSPLERVELRRQGIGRYARGLLGELPRVARERGGEVVVLRRRGARRPRASLHHALSLYGTPLLRRGPFVVTMHDVAPLQWPDQYLRTGLRHRALYRAARRAAAVICPSTAARDDATRHLELDPARVHLVPEGVDESFRPVDARPAVEGPYLLYVGGMAERDPRKDVEGLVDAFAAWSRAGSRPEALVLAGASGAESRRLEERARAAGARALFTGFVDEAELPALYSGASCLVTASRYEGFGLSVLEALACGTPVAAYEGAGAIPETAGPGGLLAPLGDAAALMRAAERICDEPALRERLAGEGRRHAAGFTWERTAEMTWDVYERVAR
jgi:glycosyltransferase involved in cell wall biosynthesis